jgi:hypothetical protein
MNIKKIVDISKKGEIIFRASGLPGFRASGLDLTFPSVAAYSGNILKISLFLRDIAFAVALTVDRATKCWVRLCVPTASSAPEKLFPSLSLYHNYGMTFSLMDASRSAWPFQEF